MFIYILMKESSKEPPPVPSAAIPAPSSGSTSRAAHSLLSSTVGARQSNNAPAAPSPVPAPQPAPAASTQSDLFSLDFTTPASLVADVPNPAPRKDVKSDILSLFSSSAPSMVQPSAPVPQAGPNMQPASFMGQGGSSMWGVQSGWAPPAAPAVDPWGSFSSATSQNQAVVPQGSNQTSQNIWAGAAPSTQPIGTNVWGAPPANTDPFALQGNGAEPGQAKKDDAFGDLWGGFK